MWGFLAKAGSWAWAHKQEIAAGIRIWRVLRARRVASGQSAKDFYLDEGFKNLVKVDLLIEENLTGEED